MFRAGQQIGIYTLVNRIGLGGFGEVWLAERRAKFSTTQVAVKLPLDEQVDHATIEQEARIWVQASGHPNVLPIIEANDYDGQIVIVSEYAPDGSLEQLLQNSAGALPIKRAIELTIGILNGLEFLHSRKIIHRDLKPANILLQGDSPRLADFGISRAMRTTVISANIAGTPKYMAPEAFDGKRNVQTDIWSIGVLLYQMLAGRLPFPQDNYGELIAAILAKEPAPLPETVPAALREIVLRALSKVPGERHASAREMRDELNGFGLMTSRPAAPESAVAPVAGADVTTDKQRAGIQEQETQTVIHQGSPTGKDEGKNKAQSNRLAIRNYSPLLFVIAAAMLWSTGGLFIKLTKISGLELSFGRSLLAAITVAIFTRHEGFRLNKVTALASVLYAALLLLFVLATKETTAANAIFLQYTAPVYLLILEPLFYKEKFRRRDLITVAACVVGMSLFFVGKLRPQDVTGNLLALASGLCFACYFLLLRHRTAREVNRASSVIYGNLLLVLVAAPAGIAVLPHLSRHDALSVVYLGVVQIGLAYTLFTVAMARGARSLDAGIVGYVEPVLNPIWVFLFIGERPGQWALIGGVIILLAVVRHTLLEARRGRRSEILSADYAARPRPQPK